MTEYTSADKYYKQNVQWWRAFQGGKIWGRIF